MINSRGERFEAREKARTTHWYLSTDGRRFRVVLGPGALSALRRISRTRRVFTVRDFGADSYDGAVRISRDSECATGGVTDRFACAAPRKSRPSRIDGRLEFPRRR